MRLLKWYFRYRKKKNREVIDIEVTLQRIQLKCRNETELLEDSFPLSRWPSFLCKLASSEDEFIESDDFRHNRPTAENNALVDSRGVMKREFRRPPIPSRWLL
ncbi:hypothetical protein Hdeb2414_s0015g00440141 [Helianthus debilis subsp. tardiflorus]